ncbi:MAG: hypothetical protein ACOC4M_11435 [Promethearchaeia archaeon]
MDIIAFENKLKRKIENHFLKEYNRNLNNYELEQLNTLSISPGPDWEIRHNIESSKLEDVVEETIVDNIEMFLGEGIIHDR